MSAQTSKEADYGTKKVQLLGGGKRLGRAYNARFSDDGLAPYLAFYDTGKTGVPASVIKGYVGGNGDIFLYSKDCAYLCKNGESAFSSIAEELEDTPHFCECDGGVVFFCGTDIYLYSEGEVTKTAADYALYGVNYHYSRLFGVSKTDGVTVRWSTAGDIYDWTEGLRHSGWLKAEPQKGKIHALIPYNDRLIAVRERGLTQIKAYGATENFTIKNGDTAFLNITENTAAVCADKLLFAAYSGVYAYDGDDMEGVLTDEVGALTITEACGLGNLYCARTVIGQEDTLLLIDAEKEEVGYVSQSCDCLFAGGTLYAPCGGALYALQKSQSALWDSGYTDFGEPECKFLKRVYVDCGEEYTLTVTGANGTREFTGVKGCVSVNMAGVSFLFKLKANCAVKSIYAEYGLYGG